MSDDKQPVDWSKTTFEGSRREQLRRARSMTVRQRLEALDQLMRLAERMQTMPRHTARLHTDPDVREPLTGYRTPPTRPQARAPAALREHSPTSATMHGDVSDMSFSFEECFRLITGSFTFDGRGYAPYQWQIDLFEEWRGGTFRPIAIPTGLGKTNVMLVWLLALASQAGDGFVKISLPRRFVMVVDRRTVVDQSTEVAEGLMKWLDGNPEHPVTVALASLASQTHLPNKHVVSISTLRGERADNGDWKRDPARPAIIIGTVYKIGSRLLFWGDGDGRSMRGMHAGLLGQDVLLVHDEAHLSPAFAQLLRQVPRMQQPRSALKPFHCVELTATPSATNDDALRLPEGDRTNPAVAKRLCARKVLSLRELGDEVAPAVKRTSILEQALTFADARMTVLIYVTSPDEAASIAGQLRKQARQCDVLLLAGTLRGHERDQLAKNPIFQRFVHRQEMPQTTYLVSTSAGAVGIDLDADAAVFDLCTLDNFIQRAGRINRSGGEQRVAPITLVYADSDFAKFDKQGQISEIVRPNLHKTLEILQQLPASDRGLDASPEALTNLVSHPSYREACEPLPRMRELDAYLLDTWSMTSLKPRVGPEVAPWLRGISATDPPQTTLVWRELPSTGNDAGDYRRIDAWLTAYPVRVAEKSSIRTDRARKFFEALTKRLDELEPFTLFPVVSAYGDVAMHSLTELAAPSSSLAEAMVILPVRLGGLSVDGFPDPSRSNPVPDVADHPNTRERWRLSRTEDGWVAVRANEVLQLDADTFERAASALEKQRILRTAWIDILACDSDDRESVSTACIYLVARRPAFPDDRESGAQSVKTQPLDQHLQCVAASARAIGLALGLDSTLVEQLAQAGAAHDRGKARSWWQHAAGNFSNEILAKCYGRQADWHRLRGYRHEFGSLLDLNDEGVDDELILHLVASHHGRARPGFDARAFDNQHTLARNEQACLEVELRFDRLQRRYGWWGLAYLEALLKCADVMGSREASA